jgi:hypothetical protein
MPAIDQITKFFEAYWPALLALASLTTFVNNLVQRLPDRFARLKNIVNTVCVDFVALLAEVGGALNLGPRKKPPSDPPAAGTVTRIILPSLVLALVATLGCTSLSSIEPIITRAETLATQAQFVLELAKSAGLTPEAVASAATEVKSGHPGEAVELVYGGLVAAKAAGAPIDQTKLDIVHGIRDMFAVEALQNGMRAVSKPEP